VPITTRVVSSTSTQTGCTRYNIMWSSLSVTCDRSVVFSASSISSTNKTDRHDITEILLIEWASMLENNEWTCTTRMSKYVRIEWATMVGKNEWACTTRMGEYVQIEWATMLEKNEWYVYDYPFLPFCTNITCMYSRHGFGSIYSLTCPLIDIHTWIQYTAGWDW
jgi:hypothetical protein